MTNVLLIVLDAVRAHNTSLHGYERQTTPFLENFAEQATWYTQARAPGVASVQSHTSIFTGLSVSQHGLKDSSQRLEAGHTIWEELANHGYDTGVFSYNSYLTQAPVGLKDAFSVVESGYDQRVPFPEAYDPDDLESDGLTRYWEFVRSIRDSGKPLRSLVNGISQWERTQPILPESLRGHSVVPDNIFTDLFLNWQTERDRPWAACVNYMGAHSPYIPSQVHNKWAGERELKIMRSVDDHAWSFITGRREWSERALLENLYDGCIHQVDAEVKRLITELKSRGVLEDTFIVITADHGEGFGEDGLVRPVRSVAHGNSGGPEEGLLHVPLLVSNPNQKEPSRVDRVASLTAFPEAVRTVLEGTEREPLFVPEDDIVLASMFEFTADDRERLPDFVSEADYNDYKYGSRVVYQTTDDERIQKQAEWNGEIFSFDCTNIHSTNEFNQVEENIIDESFESVSPVDIIEGSEEGLSGEVKDRLEQLGYR